MRVEPGGLRMDHPDVIDAEDGAAAPWTFFQSLWEMLTDPRAAWPAKILAALAILYVLAPVDLIPDFLPIVGLGDDLVAVLTMIASLIAAAQRYAAERGHR